MQFDRPALLHTPRGSTALRLSVARSPWRRFRGLMLTRRLEGIPDLHGLLIPDCASVHGFFMRYPLDVAYLAPVAGSVAAWRVTQVERLRPWGLSWSRRPSAAARATGTPARGTHALELPAGTALALHLMPGDRLEVIA